MRKRKPSRAIDHPVETLRPNGLISHTPHSGFATLQRQVGNRVLGHSLAAPSTGCGCGSCGGPNGSAHANIPIQRLVGGVIQRTQQDYTNGFVKGFHEGFYDGFKDGLEELLENGVLNGQTVQQLKAHYANPGNLTVPPVDFSDYDRHETAFDHYESGKVVGTGKGVDNGYDHAITNYGYSRKYSAIPGGNKNQALQDNHGMCVYCNAQPSADVDHVEPLKQHWLTRGARMEVTARSNEANQLNNLVGACATCNRSKGAKRLGISWWPPGWGGGHWWPWGPARAVNHNNPPPCW